VAIERDGATVDQNVFIAFHNHTMVVAGPGARAPVTDAGDGTAHDGGMVAPRLDAPAVGC
jgi:hypothetical protein